MQLNLSIKQLTYEQYQQISPAYKGIIWKILTCFFLTCDNSLVRYLSGGATSTLETPLPIYTIMFFQYLCALLFFLPWLKQQPKNFFTTKYPLLHGIRLIVIIGSISLWYLSLKFIPLVQALAINFIGPIVTVFAAMLLLKEKLDLRKGTAIILAITGLFFISRPDKGIDGYEASGLLLLLPIAAALLAAGSKLIARQLMLLNELPSLLVFYLVVCILPVSLIPTFFYGLVLPSIEHLPYLALMGALTIVINYAFVKAYSYSEITTLLPFGIPTKILFGGLISYLVFNELPQTFAIITGILLLTISSIILHYRKASK